VAECGQFELFRKGEWLTKERSGDDAGVYPAPAYGRTADYHNIVGIQNDAPPATEPWYDFFADYDEVATSQRGGQWADGVAAGDPVTKASLQPTYVYVQDVATNLYNRAAFPPSSALDDVIHASRSLLWLEPDHVVVYDRATTATAGRFKHFNLVLVQATDATGNPTTPSIAGNLVTGTTPAGQSLFVQSLLPATPTTTLTTTLVEEENPVAALDPTEAGPTVNGSSTASGSRLQIEDAANPLDVRFLNVLEGADPGQLPDPAVLVQTAGEAFDGAVIERTQSGANANVLVLFMQDIATPPPASWSATVALPAAIPAGNSFVADLQPATMYYVVVNGNQVTVSTDTAANANAIAVETDSGGVLVF